MEKNGINKNRILISGVIIILFSIVFDYLDNSILPNMHFRVHARHIQHEILAKEDKILRVYEKIKDDPYKSLLGQMDYIVNDLADKRMYFYLYKAKDLVLWSSNKVVPPYPEEIVANLHLVELDNGFYLQQSFMIDEYKFMALISVQRNYPYENQYLLNNFLIAGDNSKIKIDSLPDSKYLNHTFYNSNGEEIFTVSFYDENVYKNWVILLYLLGAFLVFIFINRQINIFVLSKNYYRAALIYLATIAFTVIGWKILAIPSVLFKHPLFSPEIYASSAFFSSIGDLFTTVFFIFWTIILITRHFCFTLPAKFYLRAFAVFILFLLFLFLCHFVAVQINSLVTNSSIPLDVGDFSRFNIFSLVAFLILFLILYSLIRISYYIQCIIGSTHLKPLVWFFMLGIAVLIYYLIYMNSEHLCLLNIPLALSIWAVIFVFQNLKPQNTNTFLILIMICSGYAAHQIIKSNKEREIENRKHLITAIASGRDALTEELIREEMSKIKNDNYVKNFFLNPLISKSALTNRLSQLYFSGFFSTYEANINTYLPNKLAYKSGVFLSYSGYEKIADEAQLIDSDHGTYFINTYEGSPYYLSFLDIMKDDLSIGSLVIEIRKKPFLEQSVYPELIIERNIKRSEELKKYAYAIYLNNKLVNQGGDYAYSFELRHYHDPTIAFYSFREGNHNHLVFQQNEKFVIIMSKAEHKIFTSIALFCLLFILATMMLTIGNYVNKLLHIIEKHGYFTSMFRRNLNPFNNLSFKFKIQLAIMVSIFFALSVTGFFTIRFITKNSADNTRNKLRKEIRVVAENADKLLKKDPTFSDELIAAIRNTANLYRIDINLFDSKGMLIITTQPSVYNRKVISSVIDAKAFFHLSHLKESQFIHYEKIGGRINYLSAYMPVIDKNNKPVAFINLPYYSKEKELKDEITSLIVTIVNLYVFLFLLILLSSVAIATTFTEPLELIKKHLKYLQLGKPNVKIEWEGRDEIGSLIQEYNAMLDKVERSAAAIARNEREVAWREMAKQVAHEIKNPLTPMKLSLQQLLRAWDDKQPDMDSRIRKTVEILINRIETLSKIAVEFSEFARMPEPQFERCLVEDVLIEIVEFFDSTRLIALNLHTSSTYIMADEEQLGRALNNLIRNALQSIPAGREPDIQMSSNLYDDQVIISISDNGSGIPDELKDKIFLPNFSTKSSGMGLGLAIVNRIVKTAGGEIWFDTEINKGTTFFISFPVYKETE